MQNNKIGCERLYNKEFARMAIDNVILWDVCAVQFSPNLSFHSLRSALCNLESVFSVQSV